MGTLTGIARLYLVVVNIVFLLVGLAFMAFGLFLRFGSSYYDDQIDAVKTSLEKTATDTSTGTLNLDDFDVSEMILTIAVGVIMFGLVVAAVSLLGCLGGCCGQKKLLVGYVVVCLVLLVIQVVAIGIVYGSPDTVHSPVKDKLKSDIKSDYAGLLGTDVVSAGWNIAMQKLECCGVDTYNDFTGATNWDASTNSLVTPIACCRTLPTGSSGADLVCATTPTTSNNYLNTGCYDTVWDMTLGHFTVVVACACIGVFQLVIILCGIYIICTHDKQKTDTAEKLPEKKNPKSAMAF